MSTSTKVKVYEEVLNKLRQFINGNELSPGDKLPSERELSEQLKAGRSSVREALRAMELLGLIETRHGEGTFLSAYRPYHMVELLSTFILQEPKTKTDLQLVKKVIEKEAIKIASSKIKESEIIQLDAILTNYEDIKSMHYHYFKLIVEHTGNELLQKIWLLLESFSHRIEGTTYEELFYKEIIVLLRNKEYKEIETLYEG